MRPSCTFCARKHLAQALVLLHEARQGYPLHRWYAIGHLAEAADELIADERESVRDVAHALRQDRKQLEVDEHYVVPVPQYLQQLCNEEGISDQPGTTPSPSVLNPPAIRLDPLMAAIRDHTVTATLDVHPSKSALGPPCSPCEEAKRQRAASLAAANAGIIEKEVKASKDAKRPRLMLITTLSDFNPSYSLSTVILDQAHAGLLAGFDVDVLVMESANLSQLNGIPSGMSIRQVVPASTWKEDVVDDGVAKDLAKLLIAWCEQYQPDLIITHDLVFQSWFVTFAKAFHIASASVELGFSKVMHMAHSAPGFGHAPPPVGSAQWYRRRVPKDHYLLTCNAELIEPLARYYDCERDRIKVLTNARDIRAWAHMPPLASEIITRLQLHRADVVQVYPFSITRWREKGVPQLLRSFSQIRDLGSEYGFNARLVLVTCHADGDGEAFAKDLRREVGQLGMDDMVAITSDLWPATKQAGLSGDVVQALFTVSNLFLFPTWSEAASLILREAALAGCSLVLNSNVPQLKGCIPPERASWFPWAALGHGTFEDAAWLERERKLLSEVVTELVAPGPASLKRYAMARFSLESMGEGLRALLPEQPPS